MLVIFQLIRLQGEMFLRSPKQWLFWAFAFFSHFYIAFVAASTLKNFPEKEFALSGLLLAFLGYIVLTGFFPRYKKLQNIIQRHHPYKPWQRFGINTCYATLLKGEFYCDLLFIYVFVAYFPMPYAKSFLLWSGFLVLLQGYLFRKLILLLLHHQMQRRVLPIVLVVGLMPAVSILSLVYLDNFSAWALLAPMLGILLLLFVVEEYLMQAPVLPRVLSFFGGSYVQMLLSNGHFRVVFIYGMLFKILLLSLIAYGMLVRGKELPIYFIILFAGPIFIFNYALNNLWGFLKHTWLALNKNLGLRSTDFLLFSLKLMALPIAIDFALSLIFGLLNPHLFFKVMALYWVPLPLLVIVACVFALNFTVPIVTTTTIVKQRTGALVPTLVTMAVVMAFGFSMELPMVYSLALGVFYILLSIALLFRLPELWAQKKGALTYKILKSPK